MFLAERVPELSRTRIQELIRESNVRVDGHIAKVSHRVAAGENIEIEVLPRPALEALPEDLPLDLLYVDDDFVIVNKPAGMVVHAGAGHSRGTLVNALLHRLGNLSGAGGALRPGIVHRLDRETSGAMVVARNDKAHEHLLQQFRSRNVRKIYLALVHGKMPRDSGTITLPISRDLRRRTRMTARAAKGRHARTDWRVIARLDRCTLVEAVLHRAAARSARTSRPSGIRLWETRFTARHELYAPELAICLSSSGTSCMPRGSVFRIRPAAPGWKFALRCRGICEYTSNKWEHL